MNENSIIQNLTEQILSLCEPTKIILFSRKFSLSEELASFKLCVIVDDNMDLTDLESKLYIELDCEIPFDVLLYKKSEWEHHIYDDSSFAGKISRTGAVLYEL